MKQQTAAVAVVCALFPALRSQATETYAETSAPPPRVAKGLNVIVSGMLAPERERMSFGFLLGGGVEVPVGYGIDLNLGMSFQRLGSLDGPVTVVNLIEATAARRAPTAVFFGAGLGPVFALGKVRAGAKLFAGAELFHQQAVPVQVALELIMKFCDDDAALRCPAGEKQTWLAGRIGLRL